MLDPARFSLDEQVNQNWTLTVEAGTTLEDVLRPEFLANVAIRMRAYDHIRVRVDTGEWYAELLVLDCGRVWAKVIPIFTIDLTNRNVPTETDGEDYFVQYRGPHLRFCVIRKSDKAPVKEQLSSKEEAALWLTSFTRTL